MRPLSAPPVSVLLVGLGWATVTRKDKSFFDSQVFLVEERIFELDNPNLLFSLTEVTFHLTAKEISYLALKSLD